MEDLLMSGIESVTGEGLTFVSNAKELMRFNADGTVWVSPDLKPDEIARQVIEIIRALWRQQ